MLKYLIVFVLAFGSFSSAIADDKVVLQLKWEHEFQFAGYYAALWQGYYQQAGLDVEIKPVSRPDGSLVIPTNEIEQERAQFAIGSLDILLAKNRGLDLKVLAPIFQRSPNAVFSLPQVPLDNLSQLAALRIAAVEGDTTKIEIQTMFKAKGFDLSKIQFVNEPITIDTLLANKADAIVSYEISAQTEAREKNIHLNKLYPADFGMDFYGDTLYTSAKLARQKPELVEKFLKASKKGWLYALNNKQEIATRIAKELPRHLFEYQNQLEYNLAFANLIDALVQYPQKPIGSINRERWFAMNEQVRALGLISSHLATESFFFEPDRRQHGVVSTVFFYSGLVLLLRGFN